MRNPLMRGVTRGLSRSGFHVLRFNFRGVGHSDGAWGGGDPEIDDAAAAVIDAASTYPDLPMAVVGWSFGAVTALRWQARDGSSVQYAGIAPVIGPVSMVLPPVAALAPANRLFVIGDRDQFTPVRAVAEYGKAIGARVEIIDPAGIDLEAEGADAVIVACSSGQAQADALRIALARCDLAVCDLAMMTSARTARVGA